MLYESNIGLNEPGLDVVVAHAGTGIEGADVIQGWLDGLDGASDGTSDFFVLLVLQRPQVLVDDGNGVSDHLGERLPVGILPRQLLLVTELAEQTLAQVAASYTGRVQLADDFQGLVKILHG